MNYPEGMTRDYNRWREVTENRERDLKRSRRGWIPIRVPVNPDKFLAWCAARSKQPNRDALYAFVEDATGRFPSPAP